MTSPYLNTPLRTEDEYMQEQSMTDIHTPTPWTISNWSDRNPIDICGDDEKRARLARVSPGPKSDANAAFIVKACNAHDELVAALEAIAAIEDAKGNDRAPLRYARHIAKAALAAAREG